MAESARDIAPFAELLGRAAGLAFPRSRQMVLRRAVEQRVKESGIASADAYLGLVTTDAHEQERLLELATVRETYFFRHLDQLDAVGRVLRALIMERRGQKLHQLSLWSAGCATGEETYSLAIIAAEQLARDDGWDLRVVGTDLNQASIAHARAGRYGAWSFRSPPGSRERWFRTDGKRRRVIGSLRRLVRFERHNLATDLPSLPSGLERAPDIVVCRNVLMYLDGRRARRVVEQLFDALPPGGWLVVAPVEASTPSLRRFEVSVDGHAILHRRPAITKTSSAPRAERQKAPVGRRAPVATKDRNRPRPHPDRIADLPARPPVDTQRLSALDEVRVLAETGRVQEAQRRCESLAAQEPSVDAFLLLATLAEATDDLTAASDALRRACYLDPRHIAANFRLGLIERRRGSGRRARARLLRALELAKPCADDDQIPASDLSVGRLRSIASAMIR